MYRQSCNENIMKDDVKKKGIGKKGKDFYGRRKLRVGNPKSRCYYLHNQFVAPGRTPCLLTL